MSILLEFAKLLLGLAIMWFHRPIADFILEQERSLVALFRDRGVPFPAAPSTEASRNIYFLLGTFVAIFQIVRIWLMHMHLI